ncbi:MAG: alanine racemase [bacterium]|nr:alanine racemase [bacterium]
MLPSVAFDDRGLRTDDRGPTKDAMEEGRTSEATIDLAALRENFALAARLADGREVIAVVKADAYGHGAVAVGRALVSADARKLAVVNVEEAVALRDAGLAAPEILVLSGLRSAAEAREVAARGLTPVLHDEETLAFAAEAARHLGAPLGVQVEVDTGMSRMGVVPERSVAFLAQLGQTRGLDLDGVFTHFSRADDPDPESCFEQLRAFRAVLDGARDNGIEPRTIHVANSAGLLLGKPILDALPEATAVRPGLMLYGVNPAPHLDVPLRAVMRLEARILRIQELAPGTPVGYGATFRAAAPTRIATLALGYADGVPCAASGRAQVWIRGRRWPVVGRVSMDYIGVDIGPEAEADAVRLGDTAVLFGNAGRDVDGISVEEAAAWADTIAYEPLVRVGPRVKRRVIGAGEQ